mgnify:CR=1 FL=1
MFEVTTNIFDTPNNTPNVLSRVQYKGSKMSTYITQTKADTFKYRRKIPNQLKDYLHRSEIIKTIGKNQVEATNKAREYNLLIKDSIEIV